jgi:hypothetical protein
MPGIGGVSGQAVAHHVQPAKLTGNRPAELWNEILPYPCYSGQVCPTDFEIIFKGNVTADIPPNIPLSTHENAFCQVSGSGCDPSVTYSSSSNTTTVEYAGPTLYHNRVGGAAGVHFGMTAARNYTTNIKALAQSTEWTYPSSQAQSQPVVSINSTQPKTSKAWKYAIVYVAGTTSKSGGAEYATWDEISYVPPKTTPGSSGQQPKFAFKNYGSQTIYVTSSGGIFNLPVPTDPECVKTPACKENLALLAQLEQVDYPPPGSGSSPFGSLQYPPKKVLKPTK